MTAQDAADLLAYMVSLTNGVTMVSEFQILGPFNERRLKLDDEFSIEKTAANPDLKARSGTRWEVVRSNGKLGFVGIDTVEYDQSKKHNGDQATHYLLTYAESLTDQKVELQIGSDDSVKVWVNGQMVHPQSS